jgi:DNA polymerase-3 subunit alpha
MEKEVTGMYLSGHPMSKYLQTYDKIGATRTGELLEDTREQTGRYKDGEILLLLGVLSSVRLKVTKSGSRMAFVVLEDMFGSIELLVFPNVLERFGSLVAEGSVVLVKGRLSLTEDKDATLVCESLSPPPGANLQPGQQENLQEPPQGESAAHVQKSTRRPGLYLKLPGKESAHYRKAMRYIAVFDGATPLYLYFEDTKKLMQAPAQYRVSVNEVLLGALGSLLGEENVAVVR